MEPAENLVRDENVGVRVGVLGVCRAKLCKLAQKTGLGKFCFTV